MSRAKPPIWVVLLAHLRADPRKTGILIALAVVMAIVYARMLLKSGVPGSASASVGAVAGEDGAAATGDGTARQPRRVRRRVSVPGPLLTELMRNPFAVRMDQFPLAQGAREPTASVELLQGDADDEIRTAASELLLQSTICGDQPLACINGEFIRPGQEVAGFVVRTVEPTRVVLERDGIAVALYLK